MRRALCLTAALLVLTGCWDDSRGGFGPDRRPAAETQEGETTRPAVGPQAGRWISVTTPGYSYEPATLVLPANESVTLELRNTDSRPHSLTVNALSLQLTANAGETVRLPLQTPVAPATYTMYCSIPGHREQGHAGTLRVG